MRLTIMGCTTVDWVLGNTVSTVTVTGYAACMSTSCSANARTSTPTLSLWVGSVAPGTYSGVGRFMLVTITVVVWSDAWYGVAWLGAAAGGGRSGMWPFLKWTWYT